MHLRNLEVQGFVIATEILYLFNYFITQFVRMEVMSDPRFPAYSRICPQIRLFKAKTPLTIHILYLVIEYMDRDIIVESKARPGNYWAYDAER